MSLGIYIHVPFCTSKCPYCDFYSLPLRDETVADRYTDAVCRSLSQFRQYTGEAAHTLYFGGGTPSLLGGKRIARIIKTAAKLFGLEHAEITLEANPAESLYDVFSAFADAGGNRVSLGMQAATDNALAALGRRHTVRQTEQAVKDLHRSGISNLSVDILLAIPNQTKADVAQAVSCAASLGATHLSAYLLKIEPDTLFGKHTPPLPGEDETAELYLYACASAEKAGYRQYEISNFAQSGFESRHNLIYWNDDEYIGIGPAAHGFLKGTRYAYPRSLRAFLAKNPPIAEPRSAIASGGEEEYAMLRLRLREGLRNDLFFRKFAKLLPQPWIARAQSLPQTLVRADSNGIALTAQGFLLSNTLIADILW